MPKSFIWLFLTKHTYRKIVQNMETDKRVGCNLLYIGTCMEANQDASVHRIFHQQLFWYRHRHLRLLAFRLLCPLNAALNLVSCLSSMSLKIVTLRKRSVTVMANMTHCHHSKMSHFKSLSLWKMLRMQYGYWVLVTGQWDVQLHSSECVRCEVCMRHYPYHITCCLCFNDNIISSVCSVYLQIP